MNKKREMYIDRTVAKHVSKGEKNIFFCGITSQHPSHTHSFFTAVVMLFMSFYGLVSHAERAL
jgi:hypothetical protein